MSDTRAECQERADKINSIKDKIFGGIIEQARVKGLTDERCHVEIAFNSTASDLEVARFLEAFFVPNKIDPLFAIKPLMGQDFRSFNARLDQIDTALPYVENKDWAKVVESKLGLEALNTAELQLASGSKLEIATRELHEVFNQDFRSQVTG